jgi:O-antigen ligase
MTINLDKNFLLILAITAILTGGLVFFTSLSWFLLAGIFLLFLIIFFWQYPEVGIYLMVMLYPFNYLEIVYGSFNVPYVDVVAIILFVAWLLKNLYLTLQGELSWSLKGWPVWPLMLLFVVINALSLINVDNEMLLGSIKYLLRPIIFFYLMYVILPFNILKNLKQIFTAFKLMFMVGIGLSLMGIWALIFPPLEGLRRAMPIAIARVYPLGTNQNLLAEVFISIIPFALILFWLEKDQMWKNIYLLGALLMIGVNLLTLSRGGWLALAVELLILAYLKYRKEMKQIFISPIFYIFLILLMPVLYLMYDLMTSYVSVSASLARLKLINVTWILFLAHPYLGAGVGTFINNLSQFKWYLIEYGDVVDAHGFLFKTLAEIGLLGTVSFLALLSYIVYLIFRAFQKSLKTQYSWIILGCLMVGVGQIVFQLFGTGYYWSKLWLPIGLALTCLKLTGYLPAKKNNYGQKN